MRSTPRRGSLRNLLPWPDLLRDPAREHPADQLQQPEDEQRRSEDAGNDQVHRIDLADVLLEVAGLAHAEERPEDRTQGAPERALARHGVAKAAFGQGVGGGHAPLSAGATPARAACGSAGTLPP